MDYPFYLYNDSEVITGKALRDGYRDKAYLATKCPLGRDIITQWDIARKSFQFLIY